MLGALSLVHRVLDRAAARGWSDAFSDDVLTIQWLLRWDDSDASLLCIRFPYFGESEWDIKRPDDVRENAARFIFGHRDVKAAWYKCVENAVAYIGIGDIALVGGSDDKGGKLKLSDVARSGPQIRGAITEADQQMIGQIRKHFRERIEDFKAAGAFIDSKWGQALADNPELQEEAATYLQKYAVTTTEMNKQWFRFAAALQWLDDQIPDDDLSPVTFTSVEWSRRETEIRAAVVLLWLICEPDADSFRPQITAFQEWEWNTESENASFNANRCHVGDHLLPSESRWSRLLPLWRRAWATIKSEDAQQPSGDQGDTSTTNCAEPERGQHIFASLTKREKSLVMAIHKAGRPLQGSELFQASAETSEPDSLWKAARSSLRKQHILTGRPGSRDSDDIDPDLRAHLDRIVQRG